MCASYRQRESAIKRKRLHAGAQGDLLSGELQYAVGDGGEIDSDDQLAVLPLPPDMDFLCAEGIGRLGEGDAVGDLGEADQVYTLGELYGVGKDDAITIFRK